MVFVGYGTTRDGYANAWRYRDWVIDALNQDMPYDLFVKAQIRGRLAARQRKIEGATSGPWRFRTGSLVYEP